MSVLKEEIINCLKRHGADIVGFAGSERFAGSQVKNIFPATETMIGIAFRILRGSLRGIEEGTTYYQYATTSVETLEETVMPMALLRACSVLEDYGFAALPQRRNQMIMDDTVNTNPEVDYKEIYRGIKNEIHLDFERCSVLCGLGELGLHGTLLTDDFGPLQRYCFILTDAKIEETQPVEPHLCDDCGQCVAACPGKAILPDGTIDRWQCAAYYMGANMSKNPFMPPEAFVDEPDRLAIITGATELTPTQAKKIIDQIIFYPPVKHGYVASICGKACDMACYIHLEKKNVLRKTFRSQFRKREEWKLPILNTLRNL